MNANLGWGLAVVAIAVGYSVYGWPGVALALTVIVFWLLLQFSRAMRVMRVAGQAPVGQVDSAVMLHSKMRTGMRLMDVLPLTRSLGEKVSDDPETFVWRDPSGASVRVELRGGRCTAWSLQRPDAGPDAPAVGPVASPAE
ncbi:hypothetical protein [Ideonella sp. A 288]|uniref:hypothetical protein n=1 Tax=Ideonella sp. A 288 TaxID=1962181 RepID=UPI000B4A9FB5|nr:hypothetical protein [Ideonella sp. A 288]